METTKAVVNILQPLLFLFLYQVHQFFAIGICPHLHVATVVELSNILEELLLGHSRISLCRLHTLMSKHLADSDEVGAHTIRTQDLIL